MVGSMRSCGLAELHGTFIPFTTTLRHENSHHRHTHRYHPLFTPASGQQVHPASPSGGCGGYRRADRLGRGRRHEQNLNLHLADCLNMPSKLLFLPGAAGDAQFWQPVATALSGPAEQVRYGWPGFGNNPADPAVQGLDDLAQRVGTDIVPGTALIAQSMGGIVAIKAALAHADALSHLVLCATSGGIDMQGLPVPDWRGALAAANPSWPRWFLDNREDLGTALHKLRMPVLLIWGDADPISPIAVGERLAARLPNARLHIIPGGQHDLARRQPEQVAPLISAFLAG